eukprot:Amastigsp_a179236_132.p4 type:complete len:152 gc:universal Amastigsp_a179236_132:1534-1079(-)
MTAADGSLCRVSLCCALWPALAYYGRRTFVNDHGCAKSRWCSGKRASGPRPVSGVQSVYCVTMRPRYWSAMASTRSWSMSSASTMPRSGFSRAHIMAPMTADVTWSPVAFWYGTRARVSSIESSEPCHMALRAWPASKMPSSSTPQRISCS